MHRAGNIASIGDDGSDKRKAILSYRGGERATKKTEEVLPTTCTEIVVRCIMVQRGRDDVWGEGMGEGRRRERKQTL